MKHSCPIILVFLSLLVANAFGQSSSLDLRAGWKFSTDPKKIGEIQKWATPDFDDANWATIDAGKPWEDQGFPDHDGVAWYRKRVEVPADWTEFWFGLGGVDDAYDLFVNGKKVASYGHKRNSTVWQTPTVTDITAFVEKGQPITLAIRVVDASGTGGLTRVPVAIASSKEFFDTPEEKIRALARANPAWIFPAWARGSQPSWTMIGMAGGHTKALVANDASYSPRPGGFSVQHWLWMDHQLHSPQLKNITWQMNDGFLPMPIAIWQAGESKDNAVRVTQQWFVWGKDVRDDQAMTFAVVSLENLSDAPKTISLLTAIRPYAITEGISPIKQIFRQDRWTLVNGKLALYSEQPPDSFGAASGDVGDLSAIALSGQMPGGTRASDEKGMASALLKHDLKIEPHATVQLCFRLPLTETEPTAPALALNDSLDTAKSYQHAHDFWSTTLGRAKISISEKQWADAYRASLAYLLLSLDGQTFRAGPTSGEVSAGDVVVMLHALEAAGLTEAADQVIKSFAEKKEPRAEEIVALMNYFNFRSNKDWLEKQFMNLVSSEAKLVTTGENFLLGYWNVSALRELVIAATVLSKEEGVKALSQLAKAGAHETKDKIDLAMESNKSALIPARFDDLPNSEAAVFTSAGVWPCEFHILNGSLNDVWLNRSFEGYWHRFVRPNDGGFMHHGRIWPAHGLNFANAMMRLGKRQESVKIARWHLAHESFPSLHAWAEQIGRGDKSRFVGGELPSAVTAAAYSNLFRAMFVYERGEQLVLAAGVPLDWFTKANYTVEISDWPTHFGKLGYRMSYDPAAKILRLTLTGAAKPPNGFELHPPMGAYVKGAEFDGKSADEKSYTKDFVTIPADVRAIAVKF